MATWTPDPAIIPWREVVANATFVAAPIVAVDENGTPASHYDVEIVGPRPKIIGLQISQDEAGVVIAVPPVVVVESVVEPLPAPRKIVPLTEIVSVENL